MLFTRPPRAPSLSRLIARLAAALLFALANCVLLGVLPSAGVGATLGPMAFDGNWSPLNLSTTVPSTREFCFAYDPVNDRVIHTAGGETYALVFSPGPHWVQLGIASPSSSDERGFFDRVNLRIVLLSASMDVYQMSATSSDTWHVLSVNGPKPESRQFYSAAYDLTRNRIILFGGYGRTDTWALTLGTNPTWSQITTSGPTPVPVGNAVAYDPVGDRVLIFGGSADFSYNSQSTLWELPLSNPVAWHQIATFGGLPEQRTFSQMIYDPATPRLVLFGGYNGHAISSTWQLDLNGVPTWTQLLPTGQVPAARWSHALVYRSAAPSMVMYGGLDGGYLRNGSSLAMPLAATYPTIVNVIPMAGVVGDPVTIIGTRLDQVTGVRFNGVPALIDDQAWEFIHTHVPVGATTGPITIESPAGTLPWTDDFYVGVPPVITSADPTVGRYGTQVHVSGSHLAGTVRVAFGGTGFAIIGASSDTSLDVQVDSLATSGKIWVTTNVTTAKSEFDFQRLGPVVDYFSPDSGRVGDHVIIRGLYFSDVYKVAFGNKGSAAFTVSGDTLIEAEVDSLAANGPIVVSAPGIKGTSVGSFLRLPDDPRPHVLAVRDVSADQGGKVVVAWRASDFDRPNYKSIQGYRVWRRVVLASGAQMPAGARPAEAVLGPNSGQAATYWESLVDLPAAFLRGYAYTAPTTRDSIAGDNPYTAFFVQALTKDPYVFYNSNVDSGYSVDNLAPPTPAPFAVVYGSSSNELHWSLRSTQDLREFRLYRGIDVAFPVDHAHFVTAVSDTGYTDQMGSFVYKLVAVDVHGNSSRVAMVSPSTPVSTLASLVQAVSLADRIHLEWFAGGDAGTTAQLYRRTAASDWEPLATLTADGSGMLRYDDGAIEAGTRYGYRLGLQEPGVGEVLAGEAWVLAESPRLGLLAVVPNPARAIEASASFSLADASPARLEVFDTTGRRISSQEVGSLGAGPHRVGLSSGRLRQGLYFVRLTQGSTSRTLRFTVLE